VASAGRAVDEVPGAERPFLLLDQQQALAGQDEEVLLARLRVVHARRLARLEHRERVADLVEVPRLELGPLLQHAFARLEHAPRAEDVVAHPRGLGGVDDEPTRTNRREAGADVSEPSLANRHAGSLAPRTPAGP
jgi:hypothetical protein